MKKSVLLIYLPLLLTLFVNQSCKKDEPDDPFSGYRETVKVDITATGATITDSNKDYDNGTAVINKDGGNIILDLTNSTEIESPWNVVFYYDNNQRSSYSYEKVTTDATNDWIWHETTYPWSISQPFDCGWAEAIMKDESGVKKLYVTVSPNTSGKDRSINIHFETLTSDMTSYLGIIEIKQEK